MIDDIFKIRFIEEVAKIAREKDPKTKRKLNSFAFVSYILALGSTAGTVELLLRAYYYPTVFLTLVHFFVIVIMFGFAATFMLTFVIFTLAYLKVDMMRSCFSKLKCSVDKNKINPGETIKVNVSFKLVKRELKDIRLKLNCMKEVMSKYANVESVSVKKEFECETVLAETVRAGKDELNFSAMISFPQDAKQSQPELKQGVDKIVWNLTVDFNFLDWHSYSEVLSIKVI